MTLFVERDQQGKVAGVFARPQQGLAEEALPDNDPEIIAFRTPAAVSRPLDAEELYDMLKTKGVVVDGDRPRPKPMKV